MRRGIVWTSAAPWLLLERNLSSPSRRRLNDSNLEAVLPADPSLSLVRYPPGELLADHSHALGGVSIVLGGALEERVGRIEARAGMGDIVVKPPDIVHRNRFGPAGAVLLSIADIPATLFGGIGWRWFEGTKLARRAAQAAVAMQGGDADGLAREMAWELIAAVSAVAPPRAESRIPLWLAAVRDEVAGGPGRPSVACLARRAGVHPVYLTRLFRKCFGRSISGFVRKLRAERAADLLAHSDLPVSAIAAQLDFSDQSHLCRTFRAEIGIAPSAYRAIMRAERPLLSAVGPVARIAEAGDDIAVVVELVVDGGGPELDVRMGGANRLDAGPRGEQADEAHVGDSDFLQPVDRGDRGVAGGKHRIDDDDETLGDVLRSLEIIFDRLERDRVAIKADMGDPRRWNQLEHALGHGEAGAKDRGDDQLLAGDRGRLGRRDRGFDADELGRQVAGHFVAEQGRDLPDDRPEQLHGGRPVAQERELVLHQGVANDRQSIHF
jgi:AraC family transcriptional regulator